MLVNCQSDIINIQSGGQLRLRVLLLLSFQRKMAAWHGHSFGIQISPLLHFDFQIGWSSPDKGPNPANPLVGKRCLFDTHQTPERAQVFECVSFAYRHSNPLFFWNSGETKQSNNWPVSRDWMSREQRLGGIALHSRISIHCPRRVHY